MPNCRLLWVVHNKNKQVWENSQVFKALQDAIREETYSSLGESHLRRQVVGHFLDPSSQHCLIEETLSPLTGQAMA